MKSLHFSVDKAIALVESELGNSIYTIYRNFWASSSRGSEFGDKYTKLDCRLEK